MAATVLTTADEYTQNLVADLQATIQKYGQAYEIADRITITFTNPKKPIITVSKGRQV